MERAVAHLDVTVVGHGGLVAAGRQGGEQVLTFAGRRSSFVLGGGDERRPDGPGVVGGDGTGQQARQQLVVAWGTLTFTSSWARL